MLGVGDHGLLRFVIQVYLKIQFLLYVELFLDVDTVHDETIILCLFVYVLFTKDFLSGFLNCAKRIDSMDPTNEAIFFEIAMRAPLNFDLSLDEEASWAVVGTKGASHIEGLWPTKRHLSQRYGHSIAMHDLCCLVLVQHIRSHREGAHDALVLACSRLVENAA